MRGSAGEVAMNEGWAPSAATSTTIFPRAVPAATSRCATSASASANRRGSTSAVSLPALGELRRTREDLAVTRLTFAGEEREQGEDSGVAGRAEREGPERVCPPAETAHHPPEAPHRREGGVESRAADGVVDHVEAASAGVPRHLVLQRDPIARARTRPLREPAPAASRSVRRLPRPGPAPCRRRSRWRGRRAPPTR